MTHDEHHIPRKRRRTESTTNTSINNSDNQVTNFDESLYHYYEARAEHTLKIADDQIKLAEKLDNDDDLDSTQLSWNNIKGDDKRCITLTGFSSNEFIELLNICENLIPLKIGRGKRSKFTSADKFLIILCYLKHYETQAKLGENFHISKAQINRIIATTVPAIVSVLYSKFVIELEKLELSYADFPDTKFVMDVTIQKIWRPIGTFQEQKQYYSDKHKIYGLKSLTVHYRNGLVVFSCSGIPGAIHDLNIAINNAKTIKEIIDDVIEVLSGKPSGTVNERSVPTGERSETGPSRPTGSPGEKLKILADKGFIGCETYLPVITPYKKKPNKELSQNQSEYNKKLASHRIVCERWYGRLKGLFRIIASEYHNNRDDYENYFKLCTALTNYHILKHPL